MKKPLFLIQCIAAAAAMFLLPAPSYAEQKTAKACEEEWKTNKASIQAAGKLKRDFIAECRGIAQTVTAAADKPAIAAPREAGVKTVKACAAEWTANKASLQASGKKRKDFIAECRGITATVAEAAPAATTPREPTVVATSDSTGTKTVKACAAEWTANKAALQASGKKRKDFIAECRGLTVASAQPAPAATASSETAVVATTDSAGKKTFKACAAEWTASKVALQASGKKRKDFIAECRGVTIASAATPDKPASPVTPDKPASPQTQRRDTASIQDTGSTIKNPRFSPTAPTGQYAAEAEAKGHCPGEPVVWANTRSKVYHGPKSKRYGRTKRGAYICLKDAAAAGFRAAKKRKKRKAKSVAVASAR